MRLKVGSVSTADPEEAKQLWRPRTCRHVTTCSLPAGLETSCGHARALTAPEWWLCRCRVFKTWSALAGHVGSHEPDMI